MKIIRVPKHKTIQKLSESKKEIQKQHLNEGFFDDANEEDLSDGHNELDDEFGKLREEREKEEVEKWLRQYSVNDAEIICTGHGIEVNVDNHLYLANLKLTELPTFFTFNVIKGDCNLANNRFTSFKTFPRNIQGDCIATFNRIKNFDGAPNVIGTMFAEKQRVKTEYPLTDDNYREWRSSIDEKCIVQIYPSNEYGILKNINESKHEATVLIEGGSFNPDKTVTVSMDDVEVINGIKYLNELKNKL